MKIGGFQKTSLLDYPDRISAIVWTSGCNFRCPFCYNTALALGKGNVFPEDEILSFLSKRKGLVEGVVVTGGEPFMQEDLPVFLTKIKSLGFLVKVDTNGAYPEKLKALIESQLVDYIAMDVKAPKEKYSQLAGVPVDVSRINASIDLIKQKAPQYEFRTTFVPTLLVKEDIVEIGRWLQGADRYYLQQFKKMTPVLSKNLNQVVPYPREYFQETLTAVQPFFKQCSIRGV
jgi:pyruvate formate lyase activating enzyme